MGGSDAYQTLPRSLLSERIALAILVWSTNAYHPFDLALDLPCEAFTNLYHRDGGLHIDVSVVASILHQVAGWQWWTTVIRVDNVENGRHTQNV